MDLADPRSRASPRLLDEDGLRDRRAFFELTDSDLERLASLRPFAEKNTDKIVETFYELLLGHPRTKHFFPDAATVQRVKQLQRAYFLGLFEGRCDLAYARDRLRVGATHQRIGLDPTWYLGAYRRYLHLMHTELLRERSPEEARADFGSIKKIVFFDMALAIDTYIAAHLEEAQRHQVAIRELSTPVIQVHESILLLPLIGTIDTARADQVMRTVLDRVESRRARCIIIDIAGVPVMDTKVANAIIDTASAVRLLGSEVILTGITSEVARTVVRLGVTLPQIHTLSSLSEGRARPAPHWQAHRQ